MCEDPEELTTRKSWREQMYELANRIGDGTISPSQAHDVSDELTQVHRDLTEEEESEGAQE